MTTPPDPEREAAVERTRTAIAEECARHVRAVTALLVRGTFLETPIPIEPQSNRDIVVSRPGMTRAMGLAVRIADAADYVALDYEQFKWLIEEAGPKALRMMEQMS